MVLAGDETAFCCTAPADAAALAGSVADIGGVTADEVFASKQVYTATAVVCTYRRENLGLASLREEPLIALVLPRGLVSRVGKMGLSGGSSRAFPHDARVNVLVRCRAPALERRQAFRSSTGRRPNREVRCAFPRPIATGLRAGLHRQP